MGHIMRSLIVLLILLLVTPSAVAAWSGGKIVSIDARDARTEANQLVLKSGTERSVATDGALEIHAQKIVANQYTSSDGLLVGTEINMHGPNQTMETRTWTDARVDGITNRDQYRLDVAGTGSLRIDGPRLKVMGHETDTLPEDKVFQRAGSQYVWNVSQMHNLSGTAATVTLIGDFQVSFWEWDVQISNSTDGSSYWSGLRRHNETIPGTVTNEYQDRRLYLHVTNGTITLPTLWIEVTHIFANVTHLDATQAGIQLPSGELTNLMGPLHLDVGPLQSGSFSSHIVIESPPATAPATPAPTPVGPATQTPESTTDTTILSVSFFGLLLFLGLVVLFGRALRVLLLRRAMTVGDYKRVASTAGMEASRRFGPEFVVARAVSLLKTNDFVGAVKLLEQHGDRVAPAVRSYLWACVHAGQGALEEARTEAIRAILADPAMASEVGANRALRGFLKEMEGDGYS